MRLQTYQTWLLVCLALLLQFSTTTALGPVRRQDDSRSTPSPSTPPSTTRQTRSSSEQTFTPRSREEESSASSVRTTPSSADFSSALPTATGIADGEDALPLNGTIPDGQLPIQPAVTPGWGVAGVILLLSGSVHALIGIKNPRVHTFFSTAYLTGLGTAVLIIYIMVPPIPLAVQGAYVVAVVLTGAILGAIATFFKEITEGFACMLGGFCLGMWLLCLRSGGLLPPGSIGPVILIISFTAASFMLYFSRWTRDYTLIFSISFSGATATVLGIDCFSRAGLKEFWAYIWNLNDNLFPLGTHTYPLTRGIEVELAAVVILSLAGIISQLKLWKVIKEHRAKKEAERAEGQRSLDQEEEAVGRTIEAENARERKLWERTYGNGDSQSIAPSNSNDSGYANNVEGEKNMDGTGNIKNSRPGSAVQVQVVEMDQISPVEEQPPAVPPKAYQPASVMSRAEHGGSVTVRVAHDDTHPAPPVGSADTPGETNTWSMPEKSTAGEKREVPADHSSVAPAVVPLPFAVPSHYDDEPRQDDERSSVATFADEDVQVLAKTQKRASLARRLSQMSMDKLRRLSQRESKTGQADANASEEELVIPRTRHDPDNGSIAATMDLDSLDGDSRSIAGASRHSMAMSINEAGGDSAETARGETSTKHTSASETIMTSTVGSANAEKMDTTSTIPAEASVENKDTAAPVDSPTEAVTDKEDAASRKAKSTVSAVESVPVNLTENHLPHALSRVAMSYRTNEWAKHLSHADVPVPDTLHISEPAEDESAAEVAAPVDLQELQQTAETGTPAPLPRSNSAMGHSLVRADSQLSMAAPPGRQVSGIAGLPSQSATISRQTSFAGPGRISANPQMRHMLPGEGPGTLSRADSRSSSSATGSVAGASATERPPVPGVVSYSSPQTLIGQRDIYLRNKMSATTIPASMATPDLYAMQNMPVEPAYAPSPIGDADDLPLSQRRDMMRRNSALRSSVSFSERPPSGLYARPVSFSSEALPFDSHQPQRYSTLPSQATRDSQLAAFRQSVQMDMRSGTPIMNTGARRESFYGAAYGSSTGLDRELEVQRSIDAQRAMMLEQKGAEAQRREMERGEKERADRAYMTMMQSGQWNDAHRDMLRKMQSAANIRD
ncbi:hypothetical protein B0T11DRAFT_131553 [Plectosphaerella cucumerina]|uniref:TM7S3/TM198-like domain-containing protein n=1 Tax=Plectosphaerella cucumerina TaxID=40658 RepID=A0A8K0WYI7_9PEZI|nr:hypothetical protein B0T11DRAFT_131553 [Plectosphaerella cucumerina]